MNEELMSIEEIEAEATPPGAQVIHLHASLLMRLCDTARAAHKLNKECEFLKDEIKKLERKLEGVEGLLKKFYEKDELLQQ